MHRVGHDQHLIKTRCGDIVGISNDFPDFKTNAKFGRVCDILNVNNCCYVVLVTFAIAEFDEPFNHLLTFLFRHSDCPIKYAFFPSKLPQENIT